MRGAAQGRHESAEGTVSALLMVDELADCIDDDPFPASPNNLLPKNDILRATHKTIQTGPARY